jgi:hypothetical protein
MGRRGAGYADGMLAPLVTSLSAAVLGAADDAVRWGTVIVGVVLTVATLVWFLAVRRHPEDAADHRDQEEFVARKPDGVARRPAGPAAENMDADPPGGYTPPGPWPGSSNVPPEASGDPDDGGRPSTA